MPAGWSFSMEATTVSTMRRRRAGRIPASAEREGDWMGRSVTAGDYNGDGIWDMATGVDLRYDRHELQLLPRPGAGLLRPVRHRPDRCGHSGAIVRSGFQHPHAVPLRLGGAVGRWGWGRGIGGRGQAATAAPQPLDPVPSLPRYGLTTPCGQLPSGRSSSAAGRWRGHRCVAGRPPQRPVTSRRPSTG